MAEYLVRYLGGSILVFHSLILTPERSFSSWWLIVLTPPFVLLLKLSWGSVFSVLDMLAGRSKVFIQCVPLLGWGATVPVMATI